MVDTTCPGHQTRNVISHHLSGSYFITTRITSRVEHNYYGPFFISRTGMCVCVCGGNDFSDVHTLGFGTTVTPILTSSTSSTATIIMTSMFLWSGPVSETHRHALRAIWDQNKSTFNPLLLIFLVQNLLLVSGNV